MSSELKLGELIHELPKSTRMAKDARNSGAYPFFVCSSSAKRSDFADYEEEAIILSTGGSAYTHYCNVKFSASGDTWALATDQTRLDTKYAYYFLEHKKKAIQEEGFQGSGLRHLQKDFIRNMDLPLPSLPEQKKIVEILSGIDRSIAQLIAKIDVLTNIRGQLVKRFLVHGPSPRLEHDGDLPQDWHIKTLDEVAQFRRGSFPQPYGNPAWFDENGFPFVQVFDIDNNGRLKSNTKSRISQAAAEKSVFIPRGSLIVSLQGSIGRVAVTQYDAYVDRTILIFADYEKDLDREYFSLLIGDLFTRQAEVADGGVIKTITKQTLRNFSIHIPPLGEQRKMSGIILAVDRPISLCKEKLLKCSLLKQSLMGDLLSGRKRVTL